MRTIFVNLPVKDPARSREFFAELGFGHNPQFSDDSNTCVVIDENIYVMCMTEDRFRDFINGEIADPSSTEVLNALSCDSREEVDRIRDAALANGGSEWKPNLEQGPMYGASFRDPDGHVWELAYMDMAALEEFGGETP